MNKKKIASIVACLCLAASAVVGGTLAYFTDTDNATNVFTVGNVDIEQNEWQRGAEGKIVKFEQNKKLMPAVLSKLTKSPLTVGKYTFNIRSLEGNYVDKIVDVTNNGTEDAYVRTIIAIPNMNGYDDDSPVENPLHWNYLDATDFSNVGWNWSGSKSGNATTQTDKISDVTINGVSYDLYVATYNTALAAKATTSPSMVGLYLDDDVNADANGYYSVQNGQTIRLDNYFKKNTTTGNIELNILVASQACQTTGFADAWEALDECFGDITATNHPWYVAPTTTPEAGE